MRLSSDACLQARALLARRLGLDFPDGRQADLERGLLRACRESPVPVPDAYLAWLATLPAESDEWRRLAGRLTVGETYFFRDRACMEALEHAVLPALIGFRRSIGILRLRLWSAGCATGEEPYSLAMLLDRLLPDRADWAVTLLATDINAEALETARRACYREWSFRETPRWARERYFRRRAGETSELDPAIREMVTLAPLNLAEAGYPALVTNTSAMDVVLCRNVLMYFTREMQRATVDRLRAALVAGGWLAVSPAEASADVMHPLVPVNLPGAIFFRKEPVPAAPSAVPAVLEPARVIEPPAPAAAPRSVAVVPVEAPPDPATELARARALADQGDLEAALDRCAAVLARDRLDFDAHLLVAEIQHERGDVRAAVEALRRAVYLVPDSAPANFLLGSLLLRQRKRAQAQRCLETAVRALGALPPDHVVAWSGGLTASRLLETARACLEAGR